MFSGTRFTETQLCSEVYISWQNLGFLGHFSENNNNNNFTDNTKLFLSLVASATFALFKS